MVQAEQADAVLVVGVFDGLPQRCILLVRGVRARRGGVAREARAESRPTNQCLAERCKFGCRGLHDMHPKKDSVCCAQIFKWVYWWASNYASPGLLFWVAEGPAPRHLLRQARGGLQNDYSISATAWVPPHVQNDISY